MRLFSGFFKEKRDSAKMTLEAWRGPRTKSGINIAMVEGAYAIALFALVCVLLGIAKGQGFFTLLVLLAAVVALSVGVRRVVIPNIYNSVAGHFKWLPYEDALREETEMRAGNVQQGGTPDQITKPAPVFDKRKPATAPASDQVKNALVIYKSLTDEEKRKAAPGMIDYLMVHGAEKAYFLTYIHESDAEIKLRIGVSSIDAYINETQGDG